MISIPNTIVYTKDNCPGCAALKSKLTAEGTAFLEMKIGKDISLEEFQVQFPGVRSVPHVVKTSCGSCDQCKCSG